MRRPASDARSRTTPPSMSDPARLDATLRRIDGSGYGAYRVLRDRWRFPRFDLHVDWVQGDPFAAPSRVRVVVPPEVADLPAELLAGPSRRIGVAAALHRAFASRVGEPGMDREVDGSGRSGAIEVEPPGQAVTLHTALQVHADGSVEVRFRVGLPARGRRILGDEARRLLLELVPEIVEDTIPHSAHDPAVLRAAAEISEDQDTLRAALPALGLIAFVADGARLPRASGRDDRPLESEAVVPFASPDSLRTRIAVPNAGEIVGMGIPEGVTLVVGGGYHGKSTLLRAIATGIRNHAPGDGRERVVSRTDVVKVRAEDGRAVEAVDIGPFIDGLPGERPTGAFRTRNASGSTSQAAAIMEALEIGCSALLVDEDTAATNFMIRDRRMQALVPGDREPITPFVDRVRALHRDVGTSSILVLGGSGDYLDVADLVIAMTDYRAEDVTAAAREVAAAHPTGRAVGSDDFPWTPSERVPVRGCVSAAKGRRPRRVRVLPGAVLEFGVERVDLSALEQLSTDAERRAIGHALALAGERFVDGSRSIPEIVDEVSRAVAADGLDAIDDRRSGDLAAFRPIDVAAALSRLRTLRIR